MLTRVETYTITYKPNSVTAYESIKGLTAHSAKRIYLDLLGTVQGLTVTRTVAENVTAEFHRELAV